MQLEKIKLNRYNYYIIGKAEIKEQKHSFLERTLLQVNMCHKVYTVAEGHVL